VNDDLIKYRYLLKKHDWWFEYSDDHRVWNAGWIQLQNIRLQQQKLDPDFTIWNEHCPEEMRINKRSNQ